MVALAAISGLLTVIIVDCGFSGGCCSTVEMKARQEEYKNEDKYSGVFQ